MFCFRYIRTLLICLAWPILAHGAPLAAGDIAIVAVNTDDFDDFAWVALRDIPSNTVINFTDSSVSNGFFRWTEHLGDLLAQGPLRWSAPTAVAAGTVVRWDGLNYEWSVGTPSGAALNLSTSGDQITAYTGTIASNANAVAPWRGDPAGARLLFAVDIANSGWDNVTGGGTSASFVPPGLSVSNATALYLGGSDDAYYAGPRRGTADDLRAFLATATNWIASNEPFAPTNWPAAFEVLTRPRGTIISMQ